VNPQDSLNIAGDAARLPGSATSPITSWLRRKLRKLSRGRRRNTPLDRNGSYNRVTPYATYSPWNGDAAFRDVLRRTRGHSLVDLYRCYELWRLVEQVAPLQGSLIEVGVWRGGSGALIARRAADCGIDAPVYLCDTFRGVVKAGPADPLYKGGEHADTSRAMVEALLRSMELDRVSVLEGVFPDETGHRIEGERFRFCHIDVDTYLSARDVLAWVWPRLVVGGVVVYDDYGFAGCEGIVRHVEEQLQANDRVVIHNLNGHAVVVKTR
jgi:O-methyltransferase